MHLVHLFSSLPCILDNFSEPTSNSSILYPTISHWLSKSFFFTSIFIFIFLEVLFGFLWNWLFLGLFFESHNLNFFFHFFKYLGKLILYIFCLCGLDFAIFRLNEQTLAHVALFCPKSFIFDCLYLLNFIWRITWGLGLRWVLQQGILKQYKTECTFN